MSLLCPPGSDNPLRSILVRWIDSDKEKECSRLTVSSPSVRLNMPYAAMRPCAMPGRAVGRSLFENLPLRVACAPLPRKSYTPVLSKDHRRKMRWIRACPGKHARPHTDMKRAQSKISVFLQEGPFVLL